LVAVVLVRGIVVVGVTSAADVAVAVVVAVSVVIYNIP